MALKRKVVYGRSLSIDISLVDQANPTKYLANASVLTTEAKLYGDGALIGNPATLPVPISSSELLAWALGGTNGTEVRYRRASIVLKDASNDWCDETVELEIGGTGGEIDFGTAQGTPTSTVVRLRTGTVAGTDVIVGAALQILNCVGGTPAGEGQTRYIVAFNTTTKDVTVSPAFTITPAGTIVDYQLLPAALAPTNTPVPVDVTYINGSSVTGGATMPSQVKGVDANAITATSINSAALTAAKFGTGAIDSTVLADNAITANKIATNALTAAKFATDAITKIRDGLLNWVVFTGFTLARILRIKGTLDRGTTTGREVDTEIITSPDSGTTVTVTYDADDNKTIVSDTASGTP